MARTSGGSGSAQVAAPRGKLVDRASKVERVSPGTVKVYVWELPVRVWHWVNALAIFTLFVTGVYIGNPFVQPISIEATEASNFFMGWARDIHFITAFIFTLGWIGRLYWLIWGNRYAAEHPFRKDFWKGMWETLKFYLFLPNKKQHYVGHNPLAMFSYWLLGIMSLIMVLTGFYMLFEPQPESFWGKLFSWVPWIFGPSFMVRSWHRVVAWLIMIFVVVHVYMAIRDDLLEKSGTLSSIFTGYKVAPEEAVREELAKKSD